MSIHDEHEINVGKVSGQVRHFNKHARKPKLKLYTNTCIAKYSLKDCRGSEQLFCCANILKTFKESSFMPTIPLKDQL